ncbi:hypothetical protein ZOD2009_03040 [Haladaptatus paucihalophilus DX253]|uniref:Uncharacterized protein n=1 Tax=Haladaptatus paucihalophilus DX253 TaxID=797209 RepID=E7QNL5_HALPU|nr:hypothetical protein ZOD2009_03040 [Haladaptatus paucihalophilus DX253]
MNGSGGSGNGNSTDGGFFRVFEERTERHNRFQ